MNPEDVFLTGLILYTCIAVIECIRWEMEYRRHRAVCDTCHSTKIICGNY